MRPLRKDKPETGEPGDGENGADQSRRETVPAKEEIHVGSLASSLPSFYLAK